MSKKKSEEIRGMIRLNGSIDDGTTEMVMGLLTQYEDDDLSIDFYINTEGGDPFCALALYDYIRSLSTDVTIIAQGQVASAGVLVFLAGDERLITPNSSIMIHRPYAFNDGAIHQDAADQVSRDLENIRKTLVKIISKATGQSKKKVARLVDQSKRFYAKEAVEFGFAHKIH